MSRLSSLSSISSACVSANCFSWRLLASVTSPYPNSSRGGEEIAAAKPGIRPEIRKLGSRHAADASDADRTNSLREIPRKENIRTLSPETVYQSRPLPGGNSSTYARKPDHTRSASLPLVLALFIHVFDGGLVDHQVRSAVVAVHLDALPVVPLDICRALPRRPAARSPSECATASASDNKNSPRWSVPEASAFVRRPSPRSPSQNPGRRGPDRAAPDALRAPSFATEASCGCRGSPRAAASAGLVCGSQNFPSQRIHRQGQVDP